MGVPFLPVRGILGSAYLKVNDRFKVIPDPFGGENIVLVRGLTPDVALVHGSQGDASGNLLIPRRTDWPLAIRAARRVIATVEERVDGLVTDQRDWQLIPGIYLTALVHCPGGAGPTGFPGYYDPDPGHVALYLALSKDPATFAGYLEKFVHSGEGQWAEAQAAPDK